MILSLFTLFHVALSLAGIGSGFVVLYGLLAARRLDGWTSVFLTTTVATSVTGFFFPFHHFMPGHAVGILSLILLALAIPARYKFGLAGSWRWIYVVTAVMSLYLNFFVLIAQMFQKIPALKALAPTQTEPAFVVTQLCALVAFAVAGVLAGVKFRVSRLMPA